MYIVGFHIFCILQTKLIQRFPSTLPSPEIYERNLYILLGFSNIEVITKCYYVIRECFILCFYVRCALCKCQTVSYNIHSFVHSYVDLILTEMYRCNYYIFILQTLFSFCIIFNHSETATKQCNQRTNTHLHNVNIVYL